MRGLSRRVLTDSPAKPNQPRETPMASKYPMTLFKGGEAKEVANDGEEAKARAEGFTEPYKFQEYPKHMYLGGKRDGEDRVVKDEDEEDEAREEGFLTLHEVETAAAAEAAAKEKQARAEKKAKKK
jgi:hypothetical protein